MKRNPIELVNVQTIGAYCGRFPTVEAAIEHVKRLNGQDAWFDVRGSQVWFAGGVNC